MSVNTKKRTGGRLVVESLVAHGVRAAFCVPGESYLEVLDALYDAAGKINLITCRHEHGAAHMAEAYAKLTGSVGVCLVTRGPGACNAAIGVHTAFQDSTPMVLLVGQVARHHIGREAFQEVDYERMFAPLAKWVGQIDRPEQVPAMLGDAFRAALSGRPGPAVVALCEDMLGESCSSPVAPPLAPERPQPSPGDMERLHRILGDAARPLMMLGGGGWTAGALKHIEAFAEANNLPTCTSFRRNDLLDNKHVNFIGEMGIGPNPNLVQRFKEADVLVVAGARLGEISSQSYTLIDYPKPKQTLVHVHADHAELGRVFTPNLAIASAMGAFAEAAAGLEPAGGEKWRDWAAAARSDYLESLKPSPAEALLDLGRIMKWLDRRLPADAVVTVDAGNFSGWPQRFIRFGGGRRLLGATSGAMGYGVPAAVAAKIAQPERTAVAMVGDGGFAMTGQELATAVLCGAAPIILVFNNSMFGTIRMHQERSYPGRVIGTDLANPDFAAIARAYGAFGERVEKTEEFAPAFELAAASGKPALIELAMDPDAITTRTTLSEIRERARAGNGES